MAPASLLESGCSTPTSVETNYRFLIQDKVMKVGSTSPMCTGNEAVEVDTTKIDTTTAILDQEDSLRAITRVRGVTECSSSRKSLDWKQDKSDSCHKVSYHDNTTLVVESHTVEFFIPDENEALNKRISSTALSVEKCLTCCCLPTSELKTSGARTTMENWKNNNINNLQAQISTLSEFMCNEVLNTNKVMKLNISKLWMLGEELNLKLSNKLTKGALRSLIMSSMNKWINLESPENKRIG